MALTISGTEGWEIGSDRATITADGEGDVARDQVLDEWRTWLGNNVESAGGILSGTSLVRTDVQAVEEIANTGSSYYFWRLTATYSSLQSSQERQPRSRKTIGDDDEITFSFGSGTKNVKFALALEDSAGDTVSAAETLVGWTGGDKDEQSIEGVDIPVPSLNIIWTMYVAAGDITQTYIRNTAVRRGGVNNASWQGFDKGEARFEGGDVRYRPDADGDDMAELRLEVACQPNRLAADGNALSIPGWDPANPNTATTFTLDKRGWSYLSTPSREDVLKVGGEDIMVTLPVAAYSQQVSPYIDFSTLVP